MTDQTSGRPAISLSRIGAIASVRARRVVRTMSSMSENSAFEAFSRMEDKIVSTEKRIQASAEIDEEFTGDKLASDFKRLEKSAGAIGVDQQLLALKQKMGMLPAGAPQQNNRQLGTGKANDKREETVHAEIEDLKDET